MDLLHIAYTRRIITTVIEGMVNGSEIRDIVAHNQQQQGRLEIPRLPPKTVQYLSMPSLTDSVEGN